MAAPSSMASTTSPADLRLYHLQRPAPNIPDITKTQSYFPSLEVLFPSLAEKSTGTPTLAARELVVDISGDVATVEDLITHEQRTTPIWIRKVHLLEPVDVMSGHYVLPADGALPCFRGAWQQTLHKLNNPYNEAYTDAVFACMASRLVETGVSPHFCRFYGTYNGRAAEYSYNITDDMPTIEDEDWFRDGLRRGDYKVVIDDGDSEFETEIYYPLDDATRPAVEAGEAVLSVTDDASELGSTRSRDSSIGEADDDEMEEVDIDVSGEAVVDRPRIRLSRLSDPGSDSGSGSYSSDSEDDTEFRAILRDMPVQATIIERCEGTMDELMEAEYPDTRDGDATDDSDNSINTIEIPDPTTKESRWNAWVFQVVAALTSAQHHYDFVHNDLHTNNIMWVPTADEYLYYRIVGAKGGDRHYRVPTFGRLFKIIDFGRATFRPQAAAKSNDIWLPDGYAPDADAAGQYNFGHYYEQGKPKLGPNKSFDLCRLAISMLETLWDERPADREPAKKLTEEPGRIQNETVSPLWNLLWLWMTDKTGKNMLRTPEGRERYPDFDLYCAIARDVANAVPSQQLTLPLFNDVFRCDGVPDGVAMWTLHAGEASGPGPGPAKSKGGKGKKNN